MAAKTGAGASVSSGASYQARIGGYLLATSICGVEPEVIKEHQVLSVGFETTESIDDINVTLADGSIIYIQAKVKIDLSISKNGELRSVLQQFEQQHRNRKNISDKYFLITSSRSSRKVTYDMRAALEAFRIGPEDHFRRDQARALVEIIDELLAVISDLQAASGQYPDGDAARAILRKSFVLSMDIDTGDPIEQSLLLLLQSRNFPTALWGKIIADCLSHAKSRHTVDATKAAAHYERFRARAGQLTEQASDDLLRIEFGELNFSVGREVLLCRFPDADGAPSGLLIVELGRFDDECRERAEFFGDTCSLLNGKEVSLIRRAATSKGMQRLIEANPALIGEETVTLLPINTDEDYETGLCAETHRKRLKQIALANPRPLHCIHCGKPVSSNSAHVVEAGRSEELAVGLCHETCLAPDDRVLGAVRSQFFEGHPELINFDPNAWFRALYSGQIAFGNANLVRAEQPVLAWGGRRLKEPEGSFVVEMLLRGGGREFATLRNAIHRCSKAAAENFVELLNQQIQSRRDSDPLCYMEETKAFGPRSQLVRNFGGKERLIPVERGRVRPYDQRFAARYTRPGNWYAPLLFLRDASTGDLFSLLGSVVLLTTPLSLRNYLDNWQEAGISVPNYETASLLTDGEFDDFMLWLEDKERTAVVNPMLGPDGTTQFISGIPIVSALAAPDLP